jgi:hypothetical protein
VHIETCLVVVPFAVCHMICRIGRHTAQNQGFELDSDGSPTCILPFPSSRNPWERLPEC